MTTVPPSALNNQLPVKASNLLARQNGLGPGIAYLICCQLTQDPNDQFGYWGGKRKINNQAPKQTQAIKLLPSLAQAKLEPDPFPPQPFPSYQCWSPHSFLSRAAHDTSSKQARTKNSFGAFWKVFSQGLKSPCQIHKVVKPTKASRAKQSPCTVNHRNLCGWQLINIHGQVLLPSLHILK